MQFLKLALFSAVALGAACPAPIMGPCRFDGVTGAGCRVLSDLEPAHVDWPMCYGPGDPLLARVAALGCDELEQKPNSMFLRCHDDPAGAEVRLTVPLKPAQLRLLAMLGSMAGALLGGLAGFVGFGTIPRCLAGRTGM